MPGWQPMPYRRVAVRHAGPDPGLASPPRPWAGRAGLRAVVKAIGWAVLVVGLMSAARAGTGTVLTDDTGTTHRVAAAPQRIVSLMPSLTEAVVLLGGGDRLVGVDRYSNWPATLVSLPRLGGLEDVAVEAVVRLRPDVVLASTASRAVQRLASLGVPVLRFRSDTHEDVRRTLGQLAVLLGRPEAGPALWRRIEGELDAAAARLPVALRGQRVLFEVGGGYVAGPSSFIGQTLQRLGMAPVVDAALGPFPRPNPEALLRAQPQVVLGAQAEMATLPSRPGWSALLAVARGRVCRFEPARYDVLVRPGPRMGEAAAHIVECLEAISIREGW